MENAQFFDENGHLNDAGVMLWVDALRLKREKDLPDALKEHLELCQECRVMVFDYYEFKREDDTTDLANHYYFSQLDAAKESSTPVIPIRAQQAQSQKPAKEAAQTKEQKTAASTKNNSFSLRKQLAVAASIVVVLVSSWWISQNLGNNKNAGGTISKQTDTTKNKHLPKNTDANNLAKNSQTDSAKKQDNKENTLPKTPDNTQDTPRESKEVQNNPPVLSDAIAFLDQKITNKGETRGVNAPSPALDATFANGQGVVFQWKTGVAESYQLRLITKQTLNTPQVVKINGGLSQYKLFGLKPGKYYWELFKVNQGRNKSVGLGRFLVK